MMRARVFAEYHALAGRYWAYEILDTTRPRGAQVKHSGVRSTWHQAYTAACVTLAHTLDTGTRTFSIQPARVSISVLRASASNTGR